jgi:hypothetical protein
MSFSLILNSSNNVSTATNTQFKYTFLAGNFVAKNMEMCVASVTIPYAFPNVSTYYANTNFSIIFPVAATTQTLSITLPEGFYTLVDIQNYIENECIINNYYLVSGSQNVYFFNISTNTTLYTTQIVCSPVPTALGTYTYGSGGKWGTGAGGLPTTGYTPQFVLPSSGGINSLIGWPAGTFPDVQQTTTYTQTGSAAQVAAGISPVIAPLGSTINSIVVRCSILKNNVTVPSDILDSFPIDVQYGSNINYNPSFEKWIPINDGTYSNFLLSFVDQNLNTIYSKDSTIGVTLLIREK